MGNRQCSNDSLIKEYELTQDMIKHYDDISIRFGGVLQSGVLLFLGLSFGLLSRQHEMFIYLFPFVILFVILANLVISFFFERHRSISQIKIHRILEIEKQLGWKQFSLVNDKIKSNAIKSYPSRIMIIIYQIGLPVLLVISYLVVLFCVPQANGETILHI